MADDTAPALLFTEYDLSDLLGSAVTTRRARVVEQVVWGWIEPLLASHARPSPVPDSLFAWALELGAIAHENPAGLSSKAFGDASEGYGSERRDQILELVRTSAHGTAPTDPTVSGPARPRGRFPAGEYYPDPARPYGRHGRSWTW